MSRLVTWPRPTRSVAGLLMAVALVLAACGASAESAVEPAAPESPTATAVPPVPTATAMPEPTATPVPTATPLPAPTATAIPDPTATEVPATAVPEPEPTQEPANDATPDPAAPDPAAPDPASPDPAAEPAGLDGAAVFSANCAFCHGASGTGTGRGPSLQGIGLFFVPDASPVVNLVSNGGTNMPEFGSKLSTAEIQAVVQYVVGTFQ